MIAMRAILPLLLALPLFGQSPSQPSNLDHRIERQVRAYTGVPPDVQITLGKRTASQWPGYEKLPVTLEGNGTRKTIEFLIAKDGSKLLYVTEIDLSEDPYARNMRKIDIAGRPFRGAENAAVTVVVYDDFQCPFCSRMYVTLFNEVMTRYRDRVKIVIKDFPILDAHPWAMRAAVDAQCLAQQDPATYWVFSDYIHTHQQDVSAKTKSGADLPAMDALALETGQKRGLKADALQACLARQDQSKVEASLREGKELGVSATPTMFVNGQEVEGILTVETLRLVLDRALNEVTSAKAGQ